MTCAAFAKINLTLEVLGRRPDGYHDLRSVVMPVSLADTLEFAPAVALTSDTGYVDDLCLVAARVLDSARGASIRVTKRIPAGGGLGGGSADAAAALRALNRLWNLGHSRDELVRLAARVGSDVPALTLGGAVIMEGRGERVRPLPCALPEPLWFVLANPNVHCATKDVYARCTARAATSEDATRRMIAALEAGDLAQIAAAFDNDLQPPAVALHPEIARALDDLRAAGALGAAMSGSGSTVFGLVASAAHAEMIAAHMKGLGYAAWAVHSIAQFSSDL